MTKAELLAKLTAVAEYCHNTDEFDFPLIELLIDYIDDPEIDQTITNLYRSIVRKQVAR